MMRRIVLLTCLLLIFITACEKKDDSLRTSGEVTVSSERKFTTIWETNGFSFEKNEFVKVFIGNEDVDIVPYNITDLQNTPLGMRLSTNSTNNFGFHLNEEFSNLTAAENYFNSYLSAQAPSFVTITDTIRPFQIFTMKTNRGNWVKFLVKETRTKNPGSQSTYYEADLKYVIQRNGTLVFPE